MDIICGGFCGILTVCWCDVVNWTQVEAYSVEREGCPLICRFATMGTVKSIQHSKIGKEKFPPSFYCQQQLHEYQYSPVAVCLFYMRVSQLMAGELPSLFFFVKINHIFSHPCCSLYLPTHIQEITWWPLRKRTVPPTWGLTPTGATRYWPRFEIGHWEYWKYWLLPTCNQGT